MVKNYMHALKTLGVKCFFSCIFDGLFFVEEKTDEFVGFSFKLTQTERLHGQKLHACLEESRCEMFFS